MELEKVVAGETKRLAVFMPPGSAKSIYCSQLLPSWWFVHHPESAIIAVSHGTALAEGFGRRTRNLVAQNADTLGYTLREDSKSAGRWETVSASGAGGEYYAIGVGGSVTGRRADLLIIDDPVKDRVEAYSEATRDMTWDHYRTGLYTRLKPEGRIVLIMTRWHEDDLAGRLLNEMSAGGDQWKVLSLPALAEDPAMSTAEEPIPPDPLGRAPGEALWPDWEPLEVLEQKRATAGELYWHALFQQRPKPPAGVLFEVDKIGLLTVIPPLAIQVRSWDLAATSQQGGNDPDYTVGVKLVRTTDGRFIVTDVKRTRGLPNEVEQLILDTAAEDGRQCQIRLPEDPGQAGKMQAAYLIKKLAGYHATAHRETGAKETRAMPVVSQTNVGNIYTTDGQWRRSFIAELRDFPHGRHDDQVDALSGAFEIAGLGKGPMRINPELVMQMQHAAQLPKTPMQVQANAFGAFRR